MRDVKLLHYIYTTKEIDNSVHIWYVCTIGVVYVHTFIFMYVQQVILCTYVCTVCNIMYICMYSM